MEPWEARWVAAPDLTSAKTLLLRTRYHIGLAHQEIAALAARVAERQVALLAFPGELDAWHDGLVMQFYGSETVDDLAEALASALGGFDAWAMIDRYRDGRESTAGPVTACLERAGTSHAPAQIYLHFDEDDRDPERTVELLRAALGEDACRPVFWFRDGRVLFWEGYDPARLIARRGERALKRCAAWAIVDRSDDEFRSDGATALWTPVELEWLGFCAPGEEDDAPGSG